ncbi:MAG: hypothetical protein WC222_04765 [Parachlamydiales bacterium]|jgi:hypothetical protein
MSSIKKAGNDFERDFNALLTEVDQFKTKVKTSKIPEEEIQAIITALNAVEDDCTNVFREDMRASMEGNIPKKVFNELKKINRLLAKIDQIPNMQIRVTELIVSLRAINNHIKLLDDFERSTVEPKRIRIKGVENDRLDSY